MKLMAFKAVGHDVTPIYCNELVKLALPFEHGRVLITEGPSFKETIIDGKTVLTVKPGAGASTHPTFKVTHINAVRDAIRGLRAAACARVYQTQAEGETICR